MDKRSLQTGLLLCLHRMGTNTGRKRMNAAHGAIRYSNLFYTRNRFTHPDRLHEECDRTAVDPLDTGLPEAGNPRTESRRARP